MLKGPQNDTKLKEIRKSEKFRNFAFHAFRLQKCDIYSLPNNERKAFWINTAHLLHLHAYITVGSQL